MAFNKETGMYEGYIYCITNKVNGKQYIGQTIQTVHRRWILHQGDAKLDKNNRPLYNSFKKYGIDNFEIVEIFNCESYDKDCIHSFLNIFEKLLISKYNTLHPNGYNMTIGGDSFGREEKPVKQYDKLGNLINTYNSLQEASAICGISTSNISNACLNRQKSSGGYIWRFVDDDFSKYGKYIEYEPSYRVDKYDINGNFIDTYDSLTLAANSEKAKPIDVYLVCIGKRHTSKGFVWRFYNEQFSKYGNVKTRNIIQYSLDGIKINQFKSALYAQKITGILQTCISNTCNGNQKTAGGYIWRYANDRRGNQDINEIS